MPPARVAPATYVVMTLATLVACGHTDPPTSHATTTTVAPTTVTTAAELEPDERLCAGAMGGEDRNGQ